MKKRIVWLMMSWLMVVALLLASCGPAEVEEEEVVVTPEEEKVAPPEEEEVVAEEKEMVKVTLEKLDGTIVEKWMEKPRYGGTLVTTSSDIVGFDEAYTSYGQALTPTLHLTNDELLTGDYLKGGVGTGETSWVAGEFLGHLSVACLAESWEIPDDQTVIFHLRKGIHYALNPASEASRLVGGRELVADDVVVSVMRYYSVPGAYGYSYYKPEVRDAVKITAPDKYTVIAEWLPGYAGRLFQLCDYHSIIPPEVVEKYGDMKDWRNSVGSGAFMLTDYVAGSAVTFVKNPNYWRKHPLYPEDTMPYLDGVKWLIIPDRSTRMSALRTGKIDSLGVGWEDAEDMMRTNPELVWAKFPPGMSTLIFMRTDKPELPFCDKRVRQALQLGLENQAIVDEYYGGNAMLVVHPIAPLPEFGDMYTPLEELPEAVQELYGYHPEKARQLLAEAGYPDGFETSVICTAGYVDMLSIVKAYWEQIGVILNLEVKEAAVHNSINYRKTHKEMIVGIGVDSTPRTFANFARGQVGNSSMIDDPVINEAIDYTLEHSADWDKIVQTCKETYPYILEQAWTVPLPAPYSYVAWWPWYKDYRGESSIGYWNTGNLALYTWIDQDLKKEMGY